MSNLNYATPTRPVAIAGNDASLKEEVSRALARTVIMTERLAALRASVFGIPEEKAAANTQTPSSNVLCSTVAQLHEQLSYMEIEIGRLEHIG
jgi:hypothetical protein